MFCRARTGPQAISLGKVEDAVVTLIPTLEAAADLRLGGSGLQAKIGMREIVVKGIVLGREVVSLWLPLLAHQFRLGIIVVHMMGNRSQVVEELAINRPAVELIPQLLAN